MGRLVARILPCWGSIHSVGARVPRGLSSRARTGAGAGDGPVRAWREGRRGASEALDSPHSRPFRAAARPLDPDSSTPPATPAAGIDPAPGGPPPPHDPPQLHP